MSGPFGSSQWAYSSGPREIYPHPIGQSLRFNDDDSAYLSRTPASAGNRKTWTWSGWVKRGALGAAKTILGANTTFVEFTSADKIQFDHNGTTVATSAVYRDVSGWYHILVSVDTTQATAADRTKIYVNGTIETVTGSYVSQNTDTDVNNATQHNIGANLTPAEYFDGYMAEVNFIDGSALDPSSFGEFRSDIWVPKAYTGSYGTNGFYLTFEDGAAIGDDLSGNTNDWTVNNLVATDVVLDSPTNNFATLSPIASNMSTGSLSEGNLRNDTRRAVKRTNFAVSSGKWYMEARLVSDTNTPSLGSIGICDIGQPFASDPFISLKHVSYYGQNGNKYINQTASAYGATFATGDIIGVALDMDAGDVEFFKNNASQGSISLSTADVEEAVLFFSSGGASYAPVFQCNFGQDSSFSGTATAQGNTDDNGQGDFYYTPPTGFLALNTANLPDPTIDPAVDDVPADYFNTVLYTGTGAALSVTGVGFQPDWTWIKGRSGATDHALYDAVRGVQEQLESNTTDAETTESTGLTAFGADGFSVGALSQLNTSTATYVAWNWKAGGTPASNTDGTITSTVSVNQKAGFSVVGYTGTGANATVGHGLGAVPSMVIVKNRDQADAWQVYHGANTANPETDYLVLNTTAATADAATRWNDTLPTSSVFSIGTGAEVNTSTEDYIAYCFTEVEGFSKFGSYTGNGSADGSFVYCGFRPAFVMMKRANSTGNWVMKSVTIDPHNLADTALYANLSQAENSGVSGRPVDLLSNGFKARSTEVDINANGGTFIFMAFADQPFKYSNAR